MHVFNLNDSVWVQLTATGHRHIDRVKISIEEDADGWSEWQGWELMYTFGPMMTLGGEPPFNLSIRLSKAETAKSTGIDELDDVLKRISELESRVRLTQHRLAAAAQMCADIDRDPRIHTTVQACFSHVGKALESEPQEED